MKKAVFSDLDGTLLKDNHRFSRLTKKTVNSIQKKGIPFVVTTGRLANDAIRQARKLKVHKYDGYVLANNGASAYSFKTNSFLWMMIFTTAEIKIIFDFTYRKYKVHFFSNNSTYVYEYGENSYYWSEIMRTKYKIITKVADIAEDITHASVIANQSLDDEGASELMTKLRQLLPQLDITQYNNRVFEISCKGISKGSALQFLSHHIGIDISQTYSFGDSYNDLELIRQSGVGIAVSNAIDELKTMANEVTLSNRENGPAKYLQQFFLKKYYFYDMIKKQENSVKERIKMAVNEVKNIDEFKKTIGDAKLTFVDFYADWCGPCKMIAPIINELAKTRSDVNFIKVNVDVLQDLAQHYGILSIPTLITFQNGNELKRKTGFLTANEIKQDLLS